MNRGPVARLNSAWLAAFVALLVALGAQVLLESVLPASLEQWSLGESIGLFGAVSPGSFIWLSASVIRFVSFTSAGLVAVLLLGSLNGRLLCMLVAVAVLDSVFGQFPSKLGLLFLTLWSLSAPIGVVVGAWFASAKRAAA